jgi:osmotically-inducible protein OsmY
MKRPVETMIQQMRRTYIAFGILFAAGASLTLGACAPVVIGGAAAGVAAGVAVSQESGIESQESGIEDTAPDSQIRAEIDRLWREEGAALNSGINLQVQEGRVLLSGRVPEPEARVTAVRLAWQAEGVAEVINEIEIGDESSLADTTQDEWITTQLRAQLLADGTIASTNYSVETVNSEVYLLGVAQDQAELDRALSHARNIAYVRRVRNYMRLKTDPPGS